MDFRYKSLTKDQIRVSKEFDLWYKSDSLLACLIGAGGSGKSFMTKYLNDNIIKQNMCVSAYTHKALRVIEQFTQRRGKTIHSLHGLKPNVNLDTFSLANLSFDTMGDSLIDRYAIIEIDESSMIGKDLFTLTCERAKQFRTKILFIGDKYQLPPVSKRDEQFETQSPCFSLPTIFELKEIVRQSKDNELLPLLTMIRKDIDEGTIEFFKFVSSNKGTVTDGFEIIDLNTFKARVNTKFNDEELTKNLNYVRYTSFTNANIKAWNDYIRLCIIPDNKNILTRDDFLTGYRTICDDFIKPIIINSEDYIISDINPRMSDYKFRVYRCVLTNVYTNGQCTVEIVDHKDPSFVKYRNHIFTLHYNAANSPPSEKRRNWRNFFEFKDRYLCMLSFNLVDKNGNKHGFVTKDIDYGYGLTIHKSQGSTYNNVFVNMIDILKCKQDKTLVNKLLYVALSRASEKAYILY